MCFQRQIKVFVFKFSIFKKMAGIELVGEIIENVSSATSKYVLLVKESKEDLKGAIYKRMKSKYVKQSYDSEDVLFRDPKKSLLAIVRQNEIIYLGPILRGEPQAASGLIGPSRSQGVSESPGVSGAPGMSC